MVDSYYEWLVSMVENPSYDIYEYNKLLMELFNTEYTWTIPNDANRAQDGLELRNRYLYDGGDKECCYHLDGYCSMLEMMVALADRCEKDIMGDPYEDDDRTWYWFWRMVDNLKLDEMTDAQYDEEYVDQVLDGFLKNCVTFNGIGGLFYIRKPAQSVTKTEIWYQLMWWLEENYT